MGAKTRNRWFVGAGQGEPGECALYAFPHAGAGVAATRGLCAALAGSLDAYGVRLPGRESRVDDPVETVMEVLADKVAVELRRHAGGRRVVLYGHCAGSVIAYEVARRLDAAQLRGLAVSSHQAPGSARREPTWALPRQDFLRQVERDGYLPEDILANRELLEIYEPVVRADYELVETYEWERYGSAPGKPLAAATVAVYGRDDPAIERAHIDAWSGLTTGRFEVVTVAGGHDLLGACPGELADAVRRGLALDV
ncbi:thioesterase II family protein [Streptomyces sp. NPDC091383]|uniref:thioesterase II family protein n=1 Tax=Streptomyces sp. NPDC091383 TaxID=3365996 RepID=UPI00381DA527